jgi:glutaconate CoA-transferase subunit A
MSLTKVQTMATAIAELVPDGASVALGLQLEQMIPFAAGHEIIRQKKRELTLIGPISDILFDQLIAAGCVRHVIAAWVGNVMMGLAYNFRQAVEEGRVTITNMTNFTIALAFQAAAMGVPFLPARTALGSDLARDNELLTEMTSPFAGEKLQAVKAVAPDVTIVHVQRADADGNAHCWGNYGVMIEAARAARRLIVVAEEVVAAEVISSDPNRTVIPGFLVSAVVECPFGAHPSPVQGYYRRDDAFFQSYHAETKTAAATDAWLTRWVRDVPDRQAYLDVLGRARAEELRTKRHAFAAPTDYGY